MKFNNVLSTIQRNFAKSNFFGIATDFVLDSPPVLQPQFRSISTLASAACDRFILFSRSMEEMFLTTRLADYYKLRPVLEKKNLTNEKRYQQTNSSLAYYEILRYEQFLGLVKRRPGVTHFALLVEDQNNLCHASYKEEELYEVLRLSRLNEDFLHKRYNIGIDDVKILVDAVLTAKEKVK